ncbi:MAG: hypothetical protein H6851_14410 [Geminicoccaceae bacterium]|nr:hypothetical protein [Geminicoccaceae bacterium]MCB9944798.1 hypothetical protein [Geminicoccaceae bacterium]
MIKRTAIFIMAFLVLGGTATGTERYPDTVRKALDSDPRYRDLTVVKIYVRRPAPTHSGFMYEVVLDGDDGERLIYVDPDQDKVIYTTAPNQADEN